MKQSHTLNALGLTVSALLLLSSCASSAASDAKTGESGTRTAAPTETETAAPETEALTTEAVTAPETEAVTYELPPDPVGPFLPKPIRRTDDWKDKWGNKRHIRTDDIKDGVVSNDVYIGKEAHGERWMYYYDSIEDYTGQNLYSDNMLKRIGGLLQARADFCERKGMTFYFLLAPNKNTVYPEYMPDSPEMAEYRRIDQVYDYLKEHTTVKTIDVRPALFAAKEDYPDEILYYPLDTHWNNHGGFHAVRAVIDTIGEDFSGLHAPEKDDYQIDYFDSYFKDQAYYLGLYDTLHSDGPVYTKKDGKIGIVTEHDNHDGSGGWGQFVHAYVDPENGFQDGAHYARYENPYQPQAPSVYVIRDSFFIAMGPFLADSFSSMTACWSTGFPNLDILEKEPDIVLYECVEANMDQCFGSKTFDSLS